MIEKVKQEVMLLLKDDQSGHDFSHIERVLELSLKFATLEQADYLKVSLLALLHDVDDYKLVGEKGACKLKNAKAILEKAAVDLRIRKEILMELPRIGYSKRLEGIKPLSLEGKIVSDADMCDAMGVLGILRAYDYNKSHGIPFFKKEAFPALNIDVKTYRSKKNTSCINHFFEKLLQLKKYMLTKEGLEEALTREEIMILFLKHFFLEIGAIEWLDYLDLYLKKEKN